MAEKVIVKRKPCGLPSWVSNTTLKLRQERDEAKKRYLLIRTRHSKQTWRRLNTSLNESYRADELASLQKQMEDLQVADEKGEYNTTWKIIHDISGQNMRSNPKVKKRDGSPPPVTKNYSMNGENTSLTYSITTMDHQYLIFHHLPTRIYLFALIHLPLKKQEKPFKV